MSQLQQLEGRLPYRIDDNGVPFLNEVVRDFLDRCNISAEEFGRRLGIVTRAKHKPYTKGRIYQMLQDNSFPDEKSRRWVIAKLLQIPPALMGVEALDDLLQGLQQPTICAPTPQLNLSQPFDYEEYKIALTSFWKQHRLYTGSTSVTDIGMRISVLEHELLYEESDSKQKKKIAALLCGYHMLSSNIAMDQQNANSAISHLNYAHTVAKEKRLTRLQGGILLRRGWVFKERGEAYASQHQFDQAEKDFRLAAKDFTLGLTLSKYLPLGMRGSLILAVGTLAADQAKTPTELSDAIEKIDEAEPFIGKKSQDNDIHFIQPDEERYYIDRAAAYLSASNPLACSPKKARRELQYAIAVQPKPTPKRREAYNMVLEAKSYVIEGQTATTQKRLTHAGDCFGKATKKANEAIVLVKDIHSQVNLSRIEKIWGELQPTPFAKNNADLGYLEVQIFAVKHPYMFA